MGLLDTHLVTNLEGFEWGDKIAPGNEQMPASAVGSIQIAGQRSGVYCYQSSPFGAAAYILMPFAFTYNGLMEASRDFNYCYGRFYISILFNGLAAGQKAKVASFFDGAPSSLTEQAYLSIGSPADGAGPVLYFTDSLGATNAGSIPIAAGAGYKRVEWFIDSINSRFFLRIDGVADMLLTGLLIRTLDSFCVGAYTSPPNGYVANFDDIRVEASDTLTTIDWPGAGKVVRLAQNGDAENESSVWLDQGGGAANVYLSIDETPPDAELTYIRNGTKDKRYMADFQTAAAAGIAGTIFAVKAQSRARNEGGSIQFAQITRVGAGGIIAESGPQNFQNFYESKMSVVHDKTPDGADWTTGDIDSLRSGAILRFNVGTIWARMTTQVVQVEYDATVVGFFVPRITCDPFIGGRRQLINPRPQ